MWQIQEVYKPAIIIIIIIIIKNTKINIFSIFIF